MKEIKQRLFATIDALKDKVIRVRRDIHRHPELSGHEEHTKYLVKGILEIEGFEIKEFDDHHDLVADLVVNESKPFVAIRADMDALPIQERSGKPYASEVPGVMMASADVFEIEIFGKSAHGARPHEGVDAILVAAMCVNSLNHIILRRI